MNRDGHQEKSFFIGGEVEHTPAYGKKTLFVAGIHPADDADKIEALAREHKTPHVFLGANHSFDATHYTDYFGQTWNTLVTRLLDRGFWVTLDYPAHQHETVLKMFDAGVWQSRQFVPLLSVRIPKVQTSSVNLTVKIDDIDFMATNPGVWCMNFHEVTDSNRFTDWQDYAADVVIKEETEAVFADINKPAVNLVGLKEMFGEKEKAPEAVAKTDEAFKEFLATRPLPVTEDKNDSTLGLDVDGKSQLKADPDAEVVPEVIAAPVDTAAAYAEGAKEDPLSKEASKPKTKAVKK